MSRTRTQAETSGASEKARRSRETTQETAPEDMMLMPGPGAMSEAMMDTMRMGSSAMKHWMETSQDLARFCNARLAKDFAYMTEFGTCRSPAQVAAVWCRAASETAHDYANQLDRVMAINLDGAAAAMAKDES